MFMMLKMAKEEGGDLQYNGFKGGWQSGSSKN